MASLNLAGVFGDAVSEHLSIIRQLESQRDSVERAAALLARCLQRDNKVIWCGNGGSAAQAQHLAAELVGRFVGPRAPLPSFALTSDSSVLTAIANDFGFDEIFARQIDALCHTGDVVVGISTSGESRNVCAALRRARELGASTVAMTGKTGGRLASLADICIRAASNNPARVQEAHALVGHMLCEWIEVGYCVGGAATKGTVR